MSAAWTAIVDQPVVLHLQNPKEKFWGVLIDAAAAGVLVRGVDLAIFDDWLRQEARNEERALGPTTMFYPLWRVERMELDERVGMVASCSDRFEAVVGRPVHAVLGLTSARVSARRSTRR
ncbi:MAG: hypothetical protein MUF51_11305 [Vicinamibacteria bacterium]|jgi:hypothetical protein|nr:hypothetical protein [Vicinamibacteria bacterium]